MPDVLKPLAPITQPVTTAQFQDEIAGLCKALTQEGATIPHGAPDKLARALLSREVGGPTLVSACMNVLRADSRVVHFLDLAWRKDTQALDHLLADGTLVSFLNTPLMQALLMTTPMPDLAMERLLTHVRHRLLDCTIDAAWFFNTATLQTASALAVHTFLTEYIFFESDEEKGRVDLLCRRLNEKPADALDPFDICVAGCYRPLSTQPFSHNVKDAPWFSSDPAMQMVARVHIDEPAQEQVYRNTLPTLTGVEDETSQKVRSLYEENPYPRWMSYIRNNSAPPLTVLRYACKGFDEEAFGSTDNISILAAGCGTGVTAIEDAILWDGSETQAIDLSRASLAFAKRCADELGLTSIDFSQADILELSNWGRSFDYISSTGVLHHMKDPIAGLRSLVSLCRPGGVMRLALYSGTSRRGLSVAADFVQSQNDGSTVEGIQAARQALIDHAHPGGVCDESFASLFTTIDFYTTSMCRDLLFHVHEVNFTLPEIQEAIRDLGLDFRGFIDVKKTRIGPYQSFAPEDSLGIDLASWAQYEAQNPDAFTSLYDFTVQKPLA